MDDENRRHLDDVYNNCQKNTQLFCTTIVKYLRTTAEFVETNDVNRLLEIFTNAINDQPNQLTNSNGNNAPDVHDETSRDMFDDDDDIVPETQLPLTQAGSEDSGESVRIPFYSKALGASSESVHTKRTNDSEDESEYVHIHPESEVPNEHVNDVPQSQRLMADVDLSFMRGLQSSEHQENSSRDSSDRNHSTASNEIDEIDSAKAKTHDNAKKCYDRSGSTTPDLDFPIDAGQENNKKGDGNEVHNVNNESVFDACTQMDRADSEDELYAMSTQIPPTPVFKHPAAATSTPNVRAKSKPLNESIFDAETQMDVEEDDNMFDAATQMQSEDLFELDTQLAEITKPAEPSAPNENQEENDTEMFEACTQKLPEAVRSKDQSNTEMFEAATQKAPEPARSKQNQRFPLVVTQASQPAETPPWSLAARVSNADIEQFEEKQKAERESAKRNRKKTRYLFASSDEEDDGSSDLEFDLAKPARTISSSVKENLSDDSADATTSAKPFKSEVKMEIDNGAMVSAKKRKLNHDAVEKDQQNASKTINIPAKRATRQLSVKVSREEVERHMKAEEAAKPKKQTTPVDKKSIKSKPSKSSPKDSDAKLDTPSDVRKSQRTKKSIASVSPPIVTKTAQKERHSSDYTPQKITRHTRKRTAFLDDSDKHEDPDTPTMVATVAHSSTDFSEKYSKRRPSNRNSTRKSSRLSILFTKVNPAPYTKIIDNLGGFIVDTPQLGNVLICERVSRTFKFLYCLAKGVPVVTVDWLSKSAEHGEFQPTDAYLIVDKNAEKRFNFSLKKSLEISQRSKLFANYHILATPNAQPTTDEICEIVECAGGKYSDSASFKRKPHTKIVLITHKKDRKLWHSYRRLHPDIQIVSSEGFMQSVVQQKINFGKHELKE